MCLYVTFPPWRTSAPNLLAPVSTAATRTELHMFDYQTISNPLDLPNRLYAQTAPHPSDRTVSAITPTPSPHVHTLQLDSEVFPLAPNRLTAGGFVRYYSYTGAVQVGGSVGPMTTAGTTQTFSYALSGVDPACASGPGTAANSCGVHIHAGTTCAENALGHYYSGFVQADPWASNYTTYATNAAGGASGSLSVNTGGVQADVTGRAVIVHGYEGQRVACALLAAAPTGTVAMHASVTYDSALVGTATQSHHYALTECENIGHCPSGYMVGQACSGSTRGTAATGFCYESSTGTMECGRALSITGRGSSTPTPLEYAEAPGVAKSRCPAGFPLTATGAKLTARSVLHGGCKVPSDPNYDALAGVHVPEMCDTVADYMAGCLFPGARNYAPGSMQSGKCLYSVNGCINPAALNYNSEASVDDGSCVLRTAGCTINSAPYNPVTPGTPMFRSRYVNGLSGSAPFNNHPVYPAYAPVLNYNPAANVNTGCSIAIEGCMTAGAVNYDAAATVNSNTWCIPRVRGCMMPPQGATSTSLNTASRDHTRDGGTGNFSTIATVNVPSYCTRGRLGCNVTGSVNYDPYATVMSGRCYAPYVGCLDRTALNFNCTTVDSFAPCAEESPPTRHLAEVCNYFFSPPPAASPAGPPGAEIVEVVSIQVTVAADLSTFTPTVIGNIENVTAVQARVRREDVTVTVRAASVVITTDIRTDSSGSGQSAAAITASMATVMANPEAAATFIGNSDPALTGIQVLATPVVETKDIPILEGEPPEEGSTGAVVGGVIGGVVGLLLIGGLLFMMRKKNKPTYPA